MKLRFGLEEPAIRKICSVFSAHPEIRKAILYGSRAKGNYRPGSDIDLALVGEKLTFDTFKRIVNEIDDLDLPYTIDLSILSDITDPDVVEHIQRAGFVFYEAGAKQPNGRP